MIPDDSTYKAPARRGKPFRLAGIIVLALGVCGMALVYWAAARSPESSDPDMLDYAQSVTKAENFQMGRTYGGIGQVYVGIMNSLKNPDTQAILILSVSAVIAAACFFIAHRLDENDAVTPSR